MKVLITGGAGFLGSAFIKYLLQQDSRAEIVNFDRLNYAGNLARLELAPKTFPNRYEFIQGDIQDAKMVAEVIAKKEIQGIINFAAQTHVDRSILDSEEFVKTNVVGTQVLLEAARQAKVQRFLQISTDEVYGSCGIQDQPFSIHAPLKPSSPYSASKAGADLLCQSFRHTYDLPVLISRSCNIYGPWQYPEKMIPLFILRLLKKQKVPVYGDGKNRRCWMFVDDYVRALHLVWLKGALGEVHHIAGKDEFCNLDVCRRILAQLGNDDSQIEFVADRLGHDLRYAIDTKWLYDEQKFLQNFDFEKGLKQTVLWYKDHSHEIQI